MKFRGTLAAVLTLFVLFTPSRFARSEAQEPAAQTQTAPPITQTTLPPQAAQPQGSAPLRVMVDKSLLINTTETIKRVSVTDPSVAFVQPITPTQILVHGRAPGEISLLIWDELERSRSFDLREHFRVAERPIANEKEGCCSVVPFQNLQDLRREDRVRPIIKGKRDQRLMGPNSINDLWRESLKQIQDTKRLDPKYNEPDADERTDRQE